MASTSGSEFWELETEAPSEQLRRGSSPSRQVTEEEELVWAAIERLPSVKRKKYALLRNSRKAAEAAGADVSAEEAGEVEAVDVTKLDRVGRQKVLQKALATNAQDNYNLLAGVKARFDRFMDL